MINEERARLMTKLAIYEETKGKDYLPIGEFYKKDYIAKKLIGSLFLGTIAYGMLAGLVVLGQGDDALDRVVSVNPTILIGTFAGGYAVFLAIYLSITYGIASYRYKKAVRSLKTYEKGLKKLESLNN